MKSSDKPELSKKWWSSEKPSEIKGAELEKALQGVEKALAEEEKKGDVGSIDSSLISFQELEKAVDKTIKKELDKKKHKDEITVLEKFYSLIKSEARRLEDAKAKLEKEKDEGAEGEEEDDEEESEGKLFEKDYLYKMIKLMRSSGKELNFGFGLNTKAPEASVFLLARKGKPEKLFRALKKTGEFSNRLLTCGHALADPENGKVLLLRLDDGANEPPQIIKLGRQFLKGDKSLRFRKLKVVLPGGQTLEDLEPDTEDEEGVASGGGAKQKDDLSREIAKLENLIAAWQQTLTDVAAQIDRLRKAVEGQSDSTLRGVSDGLGSVVKEFPDLDLSKLVNAAKANDRNTYNQTLKQTAREIQVVHNLLANGPLLSTIDENPFVRTNVHATVDAVLKRIADELSLTA